MQVNKLNKALTLPYLMFCKLQVSSNLVSTATVSGSFVIWSFKSGAVDG